MICFLLLLWASAVVAAPLVDIKNSSQFESFVQKSSWIIEFYAPWCSHCQKLIPVLENVNDYAKGSVEIGKIDAIRNSDVTAKFGVTRYPTIYYKHAGVIGKYEGGRDFASFTAFVDNLSLPGLREVVNDAELYQTMSATNKNVSFVIGIPKHCQASDSCNISLEKIEVLAETLKFQVSLMVWKDYSKSWVSLCKYGRDDGKSDVHNVLCATNVDLLSIENIEDFVRSNNYPLVSELEAHNFKVLAHLNKTMVIAVIDFSDKIILGRTKEALLNVAKLEVEKDPTSIIFGYLDGIRWKKFAKHHEAVPPCILVADHDNERHAVISWKKIIPDAFEGSLLDTLEKVKARSIEMKDTDTPSLWRKLLHRIERYSWLSFLLLLSPIVFLLISRLFPHPQEKSKQQ